MEALFIIFFISLGNLVRSDDNIAMESGVSYQQSYKLYPEAGQAEHQQVTGYQNFESGKFKVDVQKYIDENQSENKNYLGYSQIVQEDLGHKPVTLSEVHGVQEVEQAYQQPQHHEYTQVQQQPQHQEHKNAYSQIYHQHKVRVQRPQTARVKHINEKEGSQKAIGYSSYVEHVRDKQEEEEIISALKEGSVGDIKRLVPKSGITFKIYQGDKGEDGQKASNNYLLLNTGGKEEESQVHHKLKLEVPAAVQTTDHEYSYLQKGSQNQYFQKGQNHEEHSENSHSNIQAAGTHGNQYQGEYFQSGLSSHSEESPQKSSLVEIGNQNSFSTIQKLKIQSENHEKPTSTAEFNKNLNLFSGHKTKLKEAYGKELTKLQYKKPYYSSGGAIKPSISLKKPLKQLGIAVKPIQMVQYQVNPQYHIESVKIPQTSFSSNSYESAVDGEGIKSHISHTTPSSQVTFKAQEQDHNGVISHTTASPHGGLGSVAENHHSHSTENIEPGKNFHSNLITYTSPKIILSEYSNVPTHTTVSSPITIESDKSSHEGFVSHTTASPEIGKEFHTTFTTASPHADSQTNHLGHDLESGRHHALISHTADSEAGREIQSSYLSLGAHSSSLSHTLGEKNHNTLIGYSTVSPHSSLEGYTHTTATPEVSVGTLKGHGHLAHSIVSPVINIPPIKETTASPHISIDVHSHTTATPNLSIEGTKSDHGSLISHTTAIPHVDYESSKLSQNHLISHLTASSYVDKDVGKTTYRHFIKHNPINTHLQAEALKGSPNSFNQVSVGKIQGTAVTHAPTPIDTYIDAESTKVSQNNFDHQKALEGSTSFNIKNAIAIEPVAHQPSLSSHQVETPGKQTDTYLVPKTPIGNQIHHGLLEKHPNFGHGAVTSSYAAVSLPEINGKYLFHPQTIMWTSDYLKQGNALSSQPLVKLHLPKEGTQNVEFPLHYSFSHLKHPLAFYYEAPMIKYPQDLHAQQSKKLPQLQHVKSNQIKFVPTANIDWNLYKAKYPNLDFSSILLKPEIMNFMKEPGKKIIPVLVKKRKNRSSKDIGSVIYGKFNGNLGPVKPNQRNEKNFRFNSRPETENSNTPTNGKETEKRNEFSVSASYKVDRSLQNVNGS